MKQAKRRLLFLRLKESSDVASNTESIRLHMAYEEGMRLDMNEETIYSELDLKVILTDIKNLSLIHISEPTRRS